MEIPTHHEGIPLDRLLFELHVYAEPELNKTRGTVWYMYGGHYVSLDTDVHSYYMLQGQETLLRGTK